MSGPPFIFSFTKENGQDICFCPINRVTKNIYIGDHNAASNLNILINNKITHIINCAKEVENYFKSEINYTNLNFHDSNEPVLKGAQVAYDKIDFILKENPKARILVHCHMGISRSSSVILYYLMKKYGYDYDKSFRALKNLRPMVQPNIYYEKQLRDLKF